MDNRFNSLLVEAIDEVLASLGEPVKNQVYIRLEEDFLIQKNEIPNRISDFSQFLFRTFGSAACLVEIKMMKRFNAKLAREIVGNLRPVLFFDDFSFNSYITAMRANTTS